MIVSEMSAAVQQELDEALAERVASAHVDLSSPALGLCTPLSNPNLRASPDGMSHTDVTLARAELVVVKGQAALAENSSEALAKVAGFEQLLTGRPRTHVPAVRRCRLTSG